MTYVAIHLEVSVAFDVETVRGGSTAKWLLRLSQQEEIIKQESNQLLTALVLIHTQDSIVNTGRVNIIYFMKFQTVSQIAKQFGRCSKYRFSMTTAEQAKITLSL